MKTGVVRVSLDAMGGDNSPEAVLNGLSEYVSIDKAVFFDIYGDSAKITAILRACKVDPSMYEIHHTAKVISAEHKPSYALRYGKGSSMYEAVNSVVLGQSDAVVSSGNTGAYMAISKFLLKTIDNIDRPALTALVPTKNGSQAIMLDLGANIDCKYNNLVEFAIMGNSAAKAILGIKNPRVAILNIGTEKNKGTEQVQKAYDVLIGNKSLDFIGYIEGRDINNDVADVVVTDGFSGNIALKCMEGAILLTLKLYEQAIKSSLLGKLSYIIGKGAFKQLKKSIDPNKLNGACLVGLQGIAIKSHGSSNATSFSSAISVAVKLCRSHFVEDITNSLRQQQK